MNDQQIKDAIRGFLNSWATGDVKKALSFLAEDVVWIAPHGTFRGTAQIENFITWVNRVNKDYKITETGIDIITQGDTGVIEHNLSGIYEGMKWELPTVCIYDFKNGKIATVRVFQDRLTLAQQVAKGFFPKWTVNTVVNATKKGLK
jgi:ketosteroid isomerase-like protein